jgi:hypothetical protein
VIETRLFDLERGGQIEDLLPVLDRDDAARGEAVAVAGPVDLVEDRNAGEWQTRSSTVL